MAELTPSERLQPCLLDRLTDDDPARPTESRDRRVFTTRQLREAVLRDLSWLLNTAQRMGTEESESNPDVYSSVLNYGVPDLTGMTTGGLDLVTLEKTIARAIRAFEPRIMPETLRVTAALDEKSMSGKALVFEVRGDLWAQPVPEPLYLKTEVDLETGQYAVEDAAAR
jgi:type VI secretion system protein ImpF